MRKQKASALHAKFQLYYTPVFLFLHVYCNVSGHVQKYQFTSTKNFTAKVEKKSEFIKVVEKCNRLKQHRSTMSSLVYMIFHVNGMQMNICHS
jgi:hypothetical protein